MKIMLFKLSNSLRMGISMIKCTLDQVIVLCIWIACIFFIAGLGVQDQFTKHRQKQAQEIKKMKYEIGERIMPYIKLKCNRCNHTFQQNVERCDELYKNDLCKSTDFSTLESDEIAVQKEKIDFLIKHFKHSVEKKLHVDNQEIIELLEDLKK